jgi:hypothetical protein
LGLKNFFGIGFLGLKNFFGSGFFGLENFSLNKYGLSHTWHWALLNKWKTQAQARPTSS